MCLDTNKSSVFLMYYHLVLVTKYRRKVINNSISNYAKAIFERIADTYNITLVEWNHDKDHIHVIFKGQPKTELTKFINSYKSATSRLIKKDYPEIKQQLWQEQFWSRSFCLLTTGDVSTEIIKDYIQKQAYNHK